MPYKAKKMWLSHKIEKDTEVKETLTQIERLIARYSDAGGSSRTSGLLEFDLGTAFRPRLKVYVVVLLLAGSVMASLALAGIVSGPIAKMWVDLSLSTSIPILVLGISLATVAKSLNESSRFAWEYLRESCRITVFACVSFLTVLAGYFAGILFPLASRSIVTSVTYYALAAVAVGGGVWCLAALAYIVVDVTKCMYPAHAVEVACNYASRKLSYAFLKEVYLSVWMGKYSERLEEVTKEMQAIRSSIDYWAMHGFSSKGENGGGWTRVIRFRRRVDFAHQYRDYNLRSLRKLDKRLEKRQAELYLAPHGMDAGEFGTLTCDKTCEDLCAAIANKLPKICCAQEDKYKEEDSQFWEEHFMKMQQAFQKATTSADLAQFSGYLGAIGDAYRVVRSARKHEAVRKYFRPDTYNRIRYLFMYSKATECLLKKSDELDEDVVISFLKVLEDSIWKQVSDEIEQGDWYVLDTFKWLVPKIYQLFAEHRNKPALWQLRARFGAFYDYASSVLSDRKDALTDEARLEIQLILHKGIIHWLWSAMEQNDGELIKALCKAAKRLVFADGKIVYHPQVLVTQHLILCGKMLELVMSNSETVEASYFQMLCFEEHDHAALRNVSFDELAEFYVEVRSKGHLRDIMREYDETVWERNPLSGGGFGTPNYRFSGNIELDYMFIYLSLFSMGRSENRLTPVGFSGYSLNTKIDTIEKGAQRVGLYGVRQSRVVLERWLSDCEELYESQKERRIADAVLCESRIQTYETTFWKGYAAGTPFLQFCRKHNHIRYRDRLVNNVGRIERSKRMFIDGGTMDCDGTPDGAHLGAELERNKLVKRIVANSSGFKPVNNKRDLLQEGAAWLEMRNCGSNDGILIVLGKLTLDSFLLADEWYIPRWRDEEDVGFAGKYKGYFIMHMFEREGSARCVALNLRGWQGIEADFSTAYTNKYGELKIREWTEEEITQAVERGAIRPEDTSKAKGNCPVGINLFWKLDEQQRPDQQEFHLSEEKDERT